MATVLENNVEVGTGSPHLYFDFSYDVVDSGSIRGYIIYTSIHALGSSSSYGYRIEQGTSLNGTLKKAEEIKAASTSHWSTPINYNTGVIYPDAATENVTLSITIVGYGQPTRSKTVTYTLPGRPPQSDISISNFNFEDGFSAAITKHVSSYVDDVTFSVGGIQFKSISNYISGTAIRLTSSELASAYRGISASSRNATVTATVTTKNGSTVVGSNSATATGTIRGTYWKKINGTWVRGVRWKKVGGVWRRTVANRKIAGAWQRGA